MHDFVHSWGEEARGDCYFNSTKQTSDEIGRMTQTSVMEITRYHCGFGPGVVPPAHTVPTPGDRRRAPSKKERGTFKLLKIVWSHTVLDPVHSMGSQKCDLDRVKKGMVCTPEPRRAVL